MKYFTQIKIYLIVLLGVFLVAMTLGYFTSNLCIQYVDRLLAEHTAKLSNSAQKTLKSITTPLGDLKRVNLHDPRLIKRTISIFFHNTCALAATLYGGVLLFVIPIIQKSLMGYVTGVVLSLDGWFGLLKRITPHGFVELPLTFIVSSFAILLSVGILKAPTNERKKTFLNNLRFATRIYFLSIPFSMIAAVLESYGRILMWGG